MIISCANEKGGSGKTSTTALLGWELASLGYKVLLVDCDPQSNLTDLMIKTKSQENTEITIDPSLFALLINNRNLKDGIIDIKDNLSLLPVASDMNLFSRWLDKQDLSEKEKVTYLKNALNNLKDDYDFIFLDVSPTMSLTNDNVFMACDWLVIMLQTQQRSLLGAKSFLEYLQTNLINTFDSKVDILGILPVLTKGQSKIDNSILKTAITDFGEGNMFNNVITAMERVKRYDLTGITEDHKNVWDKATHSVYTAVAKELINRLGVDNK
ncbi:MAG: ParA family protein [Liquorilactobacillus hordei]|uniref:Chromosome partitioning ATPase n=1 Tax=Liquorilactobacillus satsumensis DSM 16230 = JCM 12392 TaxID=1423801 RepID=A0A0R1V3A9_9LACO|nr:ParA family protein [Liquorilactobacillus satsumensis]KRM00007.1 chromosome partitioning ATPase [Liquorilactobacillus satsumensis DSM 16230 = JCM 12392]MCC7667879.1 ATPase [Liquorilactobacillus satsumensis]MCP9329830.1 AAA family ATPase [Liquorilactobacillus satsumensis]MCP9358703.1 AAA family ATPase [Liquorilactobacillus satsumensis]MCP9372646.1 AAA family ATPase [Liquorilactobacillus satsumensis]